MKNRNYPVIGRLAPALVFLLVIFQISVPAQESRRPANGLVIDQRGEAISDAAIIFRNPDSGQTIELTSGRDGQFDNGPVSGVWEVSVSASGFAAWRERLDLSSTSLPLRVVLKPGTLADIVTVTPARTEVRLLDAPASVSILTSRDLNAAAAQTIDDLLRQIPGFSIFRRSSSLVANPTTQGVSLRGAGATGASRTLVLNDGIPLNDAFGGWVYWDRIPRGSIEQIEVVRGGGSDLYGSDALSGVINVISRVISRRSTRPIIEAETSLGSLGTRDLNLLAGLRHRGLAAMLTGEALHTDGYYLIAPNRRGAADDRAGSSHRLLALRLAHDSTISGQPLALFLRGSLFDEDRRNGTRLQTNDTATESVSTGARLATADGSQWNIAIFANQQRFHQSFTSVAATRATEALTRLQFVPSRDAGLSLGWSRSAFGYQTLVAGVDIRGVRGTSDETIFTAGRATRFDSSGGRQRRTGFFLQDIFTFSPKWQLAASARVDQWRDSSAANVQRALATGVITPRFFTPRSANAFNPRISLLYRPVEQLHLRFAAYRAFRAPTLNELYREFRVGDTLTRANENLTAERLSGGEAGIAWSLPARATLRLTSYFTETTNPIVNFTESVTPTLITRQRRNLGRTRSAGIEAESEFRLSSFWRLTTGYLFADATVRQSPQDPLLTGLRVPQVPRHQFTLQSAYSNPRYLQFAIQFRASGRQFDDDRNQLPLAGFAIVDFTASRSLGRFIEIFVAVQNSLNKQYAVARTPIETLGMPRMTRGGLRLNLAR